MYGIKDTGRLLRQFDGKRWNISAIWRRNQKTVKITV